MNLFARFAYLISAACAACSLLAFAIGDPEHGRYFALLSPVWLILAKVGS